MTLNNKPNGQEPSSGTAGLVYITVLAFLNLILIGFAWLDQSWGAMWIALFLVPGINGLLALLSLLFFFEARKTPGFSAWQYWLTFIGFPLAAIVVVWVAIAMMPLHGC